MKVFNAATREDVNNNVSMILSDPNGRLDRTWSEVVAGRKSCEGRSVRTTTRRGTLEAEGKGYSEGMIVKDRNSG